MKSMLSAKTVEQVSTASVDGKTFAVREGLAALFVFLWPAIYLARNIVPVNGTFTAISNDFDILYFRYKVYLLAALSEGHFPLWSPSEAAGFQFFSNPFAQVFYPLNLLLIVYYKIVGSYMMLDHQVYTVLGLCIFALGLFFWLRVLNSNLRAVLLAVLVMSVSFKMTEMIRFTNAVHTAAWYPWILFAMTKLFHASTRKPFMMSLALFFFTICLLTAGYPYYAYYAVFLIPVYIGLLLCSPLRRHVMPAEITRTKRGLLCSVSAGGLAAVVCSPYIVAIRNLMEQTADRGGDSFKYSTAHVFNFHDTVGSLTYPPYAQTEGWYFFSITALLIIAVYILGFLGRRNQAAGLTACPEPHQKPHGMLFLLIWIAVITYISYGRESALFKLLWNTMPGFASLRVWGRLNVVLVPLFAWLLSMAYSHFEKGLFLTGETAKSQKLRLFFWLTVSYGVIFFIQQHLYRYDKLDHYWVHFPHLSGCQAYFITLGLAAFFVLALLLLFSNSVRRWKRGRVMIALLLVLAASIEMWPVGANTWVRKTSPVGMRKAACISRNNQETFAEQRITKLGAVSLTSSFGVGIMQNWNFNRYVDFLKKTKNELTNQNILLGAAAEPRRIFISQRIQYPTIHAFLNDSKRFQDTGNMVSYTGDVLIWECDMPVDGYLSFIDNWDPYWKVYVDGQASSIDLLFGTFKSVRLCKGSHRVEFRYEPNLKAIFSGMFNETRDYGIAE